MLKDKLEHLELLDGVVIDLLKTKWDTFVKSRFYKQFYMFSFYFLFSLVSFISRPGPVEKDEDDVDRTTTETNNISSYTQLYSMATKTMSINLPYSKFTQYLCIY